MASAIALLGSPGPGIAALLAVGRVEGWGAWRFYAGLQLGLAMAFGATALGLLTLVEAVPFAVNAMTPGARASSNSRSASKGGAVASGGPLRAE